MTPAICPHCGDQMDPRGLPGHIRAIHDRGLGRAWEIGQRVPLDKPKLDIRPAAVGDNRPSFKPARNGKR